MPSWGNPVEEVSASSHCKLPGREPEEALGECSDGEKRRTYMVGRILGVVDIDDDTGVVRSDIPRNRDHGWITGSTTSHRNLTA